MIDVGDGPGVAMEPPAAIRDNARHEKREDGEEPTDHAGGVQTAGALVQRLWFQELIFPFYGKA
jgi:hypothetical protein